MEIEKIKTMLAVSFIRSTVMKDNISQKLISHNVKDAELTANYINAVTGGMFSTNIQARNYYFCSEITKNSDTFDQLLILGIGLDTKANGLSLLNHKEVYGLDINASFINNIYITNGIAPKAKIIRCNFTGLPIDIVLRKLVDAGFSLKRKTHMIWESGSFYVTPRNIIRVIRLLTERLNLVSLNIDILNKNIFNNADHPQASMISSVVSFLAEIREPWTGFCHPPSFITHLKKMGYKRVEMRSHGQVEMDLLSSQKVISDLIFFISAHKQ
ncbi:class I SAM-dependent methyltransferase [Yersinia ruckeri]|uniref:class I SAM-dependent methyltransferase n=1 Tax=Yersinia ruckeri TaxID=29486 RepID=UPI00223874EA|nr:class I SAM-dependent methyltransferase [Yersinia ruckeri]MCW6563504.1 class I SAM-dependent methyltransferase [Yersinia ruckeri]MCW6576339.1 class I SAM-dependent methyltransferase [Yersinia ruckeri]